MKKYLFSQWKIISLGVILCLIELTFSILSQVYKGNLIDEVLSNQFAGKFNIILILLGMIVLHLLFLYLYNLIRIRFTQVCVSALRRDFVKAALALDYREYFALDKGEIIAKYTKQINQLEFDYFTPLSILVEMVLRTIFVVVTFYLINPLLLFFSILFFSFPMIVPRLLEKKIKQTASDKIKSFDQHLDRVSSYLKNSEVIHNFGVVSNIEERFILSNTEYYHRELDFEKRRAQGVGLSFILSLSAQGLLMGLTGYLIYQRQLSAGDFFTVLGLIGMLQLPLYWMAKFYQNILSTQPIRDGLVKFINAHQSPKEMKSLGRIQLDSYDVDFNNISFSFDEKSILNQVTMRFKQNHKYLLFGKSGSGKTTSMDLLLGYYPPLDGEITIGKTKVNQLDDYSKYITILRQDALIFQDTLRHNLTMFREIQDDRIIDLLKRVGLEKYASTVALDEELSEDGANLSGGERKRICLVRALLCDTPILILDEPYANIDEKNLSCIEDLIFGIKDKTVIIISHQINKEKWHWFDSVYHFNGGRVIC